MMTKYTISLNRHSKGNDSLRTIVTNTLELHDCVNLPFDSNGLKFLRDLVYHDLIDFNGKSIDNELIYGNKELGHLTLLFYLESDEYESIEFNEAERLTVEAFIKIIDWNSEYFPEVDNKLSSLANLSNEITANKENLTPNQFRKLLYETKYSTENIIKRALDNYINFIEVRKVKESRLR